MTRQSLPLLDISELETASRFGSCSSTSNGQNYRLHPRLAAIMPLANKGKGKGREVRQSRSRNTTPSSGLSSSTTTGASSVSGYLDNDVSKLFSSSTVQYADILERLGGGGTIPDSKTLELLGEHLKTLSQLADARGDVCNAGMRELSQRRKEVLEDQQEQMERDAEERIKMKREAEDDEDGSRALKGGKLKKRKERASKEDRPLAVGAHEITRQDGGELGELFLPQTPPRFFFFLFVFNALELVEKAGYAD